MWARERGDDWDEDVGVGVGVGVGVPTTGWRADRWFMCVASGGCVVVLCCGCETVTVTKERGGGTKGRGGEGRGGKSRGGKRRQGKAEKQSGRDLGMQQASKQQTEWRELRGAVQLVM